MSPQTRDFITITFHLYSSEKGPFDYAFLRGVKIWTVSLSRAGILPLDRRDRLCLIKTFPLVCRFIDMFNPSCSSIFSWKRKRAVYVAFLSLSHCRSMAAIISRENHPNISGLLITISVGCHSSSKPTGATKNNPASE
ncbi:hypothetical protein ARMGADRAFT_1084534 [Armillaria gallica]|uniref:Uncharacterized protein n=1 Tax=Armillaria gallica TaxID=47427 RepID=A0A2H3DMA3_ARMGA|nr:hypothetical protein ARMGADRAFT_1084534 [Armillaria gallica]